MDVAAVVTRIRNLIYNAEHHPDPGVRRAAQRALRFGERYGRTQRGGSACERVYQEIQRAETQGVRFDAIEVDPEADTRGHVPIMQYSYVRDDQVNRTVVKIDQDTFDAIAEELKLPTNKIGMLWGLPVVAHPQEGPWWTEHPQEPEPTIEFKDDTPDDVREDQAKFYELLVEPALEMGREMFNAKIAEMLASDVEKVRSHFTLEQRRRLADVACTCDRTGEFREPGDRCPVHMQFDLEASRSRRLAQALRNLRSQITIHGAQSTRRLTLLERAIDKALGNVEDETQAHDDGEDWTERDG